MSSRPPRKMPTCELVLQKPRSTDRYEWWWHPAEEWWVLKLIVKRSGVCKREHVVCHQDQTDWLRSLATQGWQPAEAAM